MGRAKTPTEEAEELRAATREAHEAMKDMRGLIREMATVEERLRETAATVFAERIEEQVAAGLAQYSESISTAIDNATEAVDRRFDTIASIMLGEDPATVRKGLPSIKDYAEQIASQRRGEG